MWRFKKSMFVSLLKRESTRNIIKFVNKNKVKYILNTLKHVIKVNILDIKVFFLTNRKIK